MSFLFSALQICGVALGLVLLFFLLRGFLPKYSILFAYNLVQILITVIETILFRETTQHDPIFVNFYWIAETVWDFLLLVLIVVLILRVLADRPEKELVQKILTIVLIGVVVLPFAIFYERPVFRTTWFRGASQFLNFGAAILNLVLWGSMIGARTRDTQLMLVCAGLGVTVAGAAIAWGIRQLARGQYILTGADLFAGLTYLMGLLIWCYAFRPGTKPYEATT
jgi:hypothetical protein